MTGGEAGIAFIHDACVDPVDFAETHIWRQSVCALISVDVSGVMLSFLDEAIRASRGQTVSPTALIAGATCVRKIRQAARSRSAVHIA